MKTGTRKPGKVEQRKGETLVLFTRQVVSDSLTPWTAACHASFPVLHYFQEFAQIHVHWVGDAIQPSHPLLPSSPFVFSLSQDQGLFQWVCCLHQVASLGASASPLVIPVNIQSWFPLGLTGLISLQSKELRSYQEFKIEIKVLIKILNATHLERLVCL